jgi:hypothetical protein
VSSTKKPRGRPTADTETIEREAKLVAEWKQASETGIAKLDFTDEKGMKVKEFDKLLDRVRKRETRSDK